MSYEEFVNQAWNDHASRAADVASRLPQGIALVENEKQLAPMAQLVTHVMGEHLGRWSEAIALLKTLSARPCAAASQDGGRAIRRAIAALELASGTETDVHEFSSSDRVRILASAAAALIGQKSVLRAQRLFLESLELAERALSKDDPANRALAVAANNLASELEELPSRTTDERELMLTAAKAARRSWEIAGGWTEVERAEYRLAMSHLKAGEPSQALQHARACLEICEANQAPALEFFFGYECLATVEAARGNEPGKAEATEKLESFFAKLSKEDQAWCRASLEKLQT
jgi:hypothetical protein